MKSPRTDLGLMLDRMAVMGGEGSTRGERVDAALGALYDMQRTWRIDETIPQCFAARGMGKDEMVAYIEAGIALLEDEKMMDL